MKKNKLKQKFKNKELTIGSWLSFDYKPICEMMINAGFDWLTIDMEHTAIDYIEARNLIQFIDAAGCIPLVRVGNNDSLTIKKVLDIGAYGVIVPMINTKQDAEKIVESVYYPPIGKRGVGLYRAHNYGLEFEHYKQWLRDECVIIVQIEHILGVKNLEQILSIEGIDGFIIGPYDLSGSLNQPGNFNHPQVIDALNVIKDILAETEKVGGYHVVFADHEQLQMRIEEGYTFIAYGVDMVFIAEKLKTESKFLQTIVRVHL